MQCALDSKGRVESGVGYVKKNFLNGAEFIDFSAVNPAAQVWLNQIANVREHAETCVVEGKSFRAKDHTPEA